MIVLSGALVLVALVLLVFGALDRNLPYVYASIGVSLLSLLLLLVGILQRRGELSGDDQDDATAVTDTSDERVPALVGAAQEQERLEGADRTAELAVPARAEERPASRRVEPAAPADDQPAAQQDADVAADVQGDLQDEELVDEEDLEGDELGDADLEDEGVDEDELDDDELDDAGSGVTVLVVSGRPRYHLEGCRVLRGKEPQPLDRDDARTHGFSPCGVCKPDADETAAAAAPAEGEQDGPSFAETIFGGPLFTDPSPDDADRGDTAALPDRPVQPVLPDVEPTTAGPADRDAVDDGVEEPDDAPLEQADDPADADAVQVEQADDPAVADDPADAVPALQGDDPADEPADDRAVDPVQAVEPAPDVAGPDELPAALDEADEASEPDGAVDEEATAEPVVEPVAAQDVPVDEPAAADEPTPAAPARARRTRSTTSVPPADPPADAAPAAKAGSRRRSGGTASSAEGAPATAPRGTSAPAGTAPAKTAPAKKAPATRAPAKKAPAKKAPARRTAAAEVAPPPEQPQVKRPVVRAVRADALRLGAPSTAGTTTRVSARAAAPVTSASVVVVPDRERFHRPECRFVRGVAGATALPKASAARQGYVACGVCKP